MACGITISPDVEQIVVNGIPSIKVEGTASECGKVFVKIKCSSSFDIPEINVPVNSDGTWFAVFPNTQCGCNKPIEVAVTCTTHPDCTESISVLLICSSDCPVISVNAQPGDCVNGKRNVVFTVNILDLSGNSFIVTQIDFGDGIPADAALTNMPGSYTRNHFYGASVNDNAFLNIILPDNCVKIHINIPFLEPCFNCPNDNDIHVSAGECDRNTDKTPFSIIIPASGFGLVNAFVDFGDGTSFGPFILDVSTDFALPTHEYAPRDQTYIITVTIGECPPAHAFTGVVRACQVQPPPQTESPLCFIARIVTVLLSSLALILTALAICFPELSHTFLILAAAAAAGAILIWVVQYLGNNCPDPCGNWYLYGWQTSITTAIGYLYYANCCPELLWAGLALVTAAIGLFYGWIRTCHPSKCDIVRELLVVVSTLLLPMIGWIDNVGILQACVSPLALAIIDTLDALIALAGAICLLNNTNNDDSQSS